MAPLRIMDQEKLQKIKKITKEFFNKTGFDIELQILDPIENTVPVKIKTAEPKILIGQNGQTLAEIQHLLKAAIKKNILENFYIDVDINNYKEKKIEYLKDMACQIADEVSLNKEEKILIPMSSYERRIIHLELAKRPNVTTSSIGFGLERKIIIKPYMNNS